MPDKNDGFNSNGNDQVNENSAQLNQIKNKSYLYLVGNVNGIIRNGGERNIKAA